MERFILPRIGQRKVADVTRDDLQPIVENLRATPYQGNRVRVLLSHMFHKAEEWGYRLDQTNPTARIPSFKEQKRERYLSEAELVRLGATLAQSEKDGSTSPQVAAVIRLLIFTGCRVSEILTLHWEFVDFDAGCLRLPDSKTGPREILLNPPARQVLAELPRDGSPWVFPGRKPGNHMRVPDKQWHGIRIRAELDDLRLHDLRHSFASIAVGLGMSLPLIGGLLGHSHASTTERYAHLADDPLRKATTAVGERIASFLYQKPDGEVIPLPSSARSTG
jgi:integrase